MNGPAPSALGAVPLRSGLAGGKRRRNGDCATETFLKGQDCIHGLLAVAGLLHVGDLAAAAIGDAGFCDLC